MKRTEKLCIAFLTVVLLVSFMSTATTRAAEVKKSGDWEYTVVKGKVWISRYFGKASNVKIPSTIEGKPVTQIGYVWFDIEAAFSKNKAVKSVVIPKSVKKIHTWVFQLTKNLKTIKVDAKNPKFSSVDGILFDKKKGTLICYPPAKPNKKYTVPNHVTTIENYAFSYCKKLENLSFGNGVRKINGMVISESSVKNITLGKNVATISTFALNYAKLQTIKVNANNKKFSSVGGVLFNKDKTTLICRPDGKTGEYKIPSSVTKIGAGAFCSNKFKNIVFTDNIKTIENGAFYQSKIKSVNIPDNVENIGASAFSSCNSLKSVVIGNGVKKLGMKGEGGQFSDCSALTTVVIGNGVESIASDTFKYCESLANITILENVVDIGNNGEDDPFQYCNKKKLTIYCKEGSYAHSYAEKNGYKYVLQ